jgi:DNA-directed RNA polymerase subunit RPC12/RpoP
MGMVENDKFNEKYLLRCKKCGQKFYPWKALMVTSEKTNWIEYLYCPNCSNFDKKDNFRIG